MTCMSCHTSHGSAFPAMLLASPKRDLCVLCHSTDGSVAGKTAAK
jgi:predicted CXXCH cytochrome family protein